MHIQNFIKIHPFVLKILRKNIFLHQSRAITLLFINKFSPFATPNHSSLTSMSMQSLKKIGQKLLKLESGNKVLTDGWTDRQTDGQTDTQMVQRVEKCPRRLTLTIGEPTYEPRHEKTCLCHMLTTKVQISLCIRAV